MAGGTEGGSFRAQNILRGLPGGGAWRSYHSRFNDTAHLRSARKFPPRNGPSDPQTENFPKSQIFRRVNLGFKNHKRETKNATFFFGCRLTTLGAHRFPCTWLRPQAGGGRWGRSLSYGFPGRGRLTGGNVGLDPLKNSAQGSPRSGMRVRGGRC